MYVSVMSGATFCFVFSASFIACFISLSESEVAQSCPTLYDPKDCSLPGSSVHGIFQAIVLEWIAISFSRGSSRPRDQTQVSAGREPLTGFATSRKFFSHGIPARKPERGVFLPEMNSGKRRNSLYGIVLCALLQRKHPINSFHL